MNDRRKPQNQILRQTLSALDPVEQDLADFTTYHGLDGFVSGAQDNEITLNDIEGMNL